MFWITSARPSVATARLTPRVRNAGSATTSPAGIATRMPTSAASQNGHPDVATSRAATQAPNPASAHWLSDSCPA